MQSILAAIVPVRLARIGLCPVSAALDSGLGSTDTYASSYISSSVRYKVSATAATRSGAGLTRKTMIPAKIALVKTNAS